MPKRPAPIFSSRSEDPDLRDEIDEFVIKLAERIDFVQDALCSAELDLLRTRVSELTQAGRRLGFSSLADAARATASAAEDGKADLAEDGVVELTQIGQRIRLGHRGAA